MNKTLKIVLIVVGIAIVLYSLTVGRYNSMVTLNQGVSQQWGQVEVVYQRRMDLIPNLVETVKGYANFEKSTLTEIAEMRSSVGRANATFHDQNASVDDKVKAINQSESALSRLLVVMENYPNLKANENFMALQTELAGTENRVSVERRKFNEAVGAYNTYILKFPSNIIAGMFNFKEKEFFKANAGAENAPSVKF